MGGKILSVSRECERERRKAQGGHHHHPMIQQAERGKEMIIDNGVSAKRGRDDDEASNFPRQRKKLRIVWKIGEKVIGSSEIERPQAQESEQRPKRPPYVVLALPVSHDDKLEATRRKFRQSYQEPKMVSF